MGILYDLLEGKLIMPGINVADTSAGKAIVFDNQAAIESLDEETLRELNEWTGASVQLTDEESYARWGIDEDGEPIILDDDEDEDDE